MKLSDLKENQHATIITINSSKIKRRLFDIGFVAGQRVECTNIGLGGTPIAYKICGSKIALRKKDADNIGVVM
ncbi:MAG: ferrous iron transport protein A [Clostridiales bacterium]|nr:ferrous iron transport protein A [Clostridiales bacterium]